LQLFIDGVMVDHTFMACAVQQWRHHLSACVKVSGEHLEHS